MKVVLQDTNGEITTLDNVISIIFNGVGDPIIRDAYSDCDYMGRLYEHHKIVVIIEEA